MNGITWNFPAAYTAARSLQEEQFSHKLCSVFKQEQGGWSAAHPSPCLGQQTQTALRPGCSSVCWNKDSSIPPGHCVYLQFPTAKIAGNGTKMPCQGRPKITSHISTHKEHMPLKPKQSATLHQANPTERESLWFQKVNRTLV